MLRVPFAQTRSAVEGESPKYNNTCEITFPGEIISSTL